MAEHLHREIENLKKKLLTVSARVETALREATLSIESEDPELAQKVIDRDLEIDDLEVEVEEECLKILALHQPVATDLRFIVAVLKINNDLERIGDLAVNIAERSLFLASHSLPNVDFDFVEMANKAQAMLTKSLDALVNFSTDLASQVRTSDDEIDALNRQMYIQVQKAVRTNPEDISALTHMLSTSRHLERVADLATNIAEDVIYMIQGRIVRHQPEDYRQRQ